MFPRRGAQAVSVIELSEQNFIAKNLCYLLINLLLILSTYLHSLLFMAMIISVD